MRQAAVEIGGIGSAPGLCVTGGVAKRDNLVLIGDRTAANGKRVGGAGIRNGPQRSGLLVCGPGPFPDAHAGPPSPAVGLAHRTRLVTCTGPPADSDRTGVVSARSTSVRVEQRRTRMTKKRR